MIEGLLTPKKKSNSAPATGGENFFFFEGPDAQAMTITRTNAPYEATPSIDGKTIDLAAANSRAVIAFNPPVNFKNPDWTLEWSDVNKTAAVSAYANQITLFPVNPPRTVVVGRFGDNGFGNRLQFGGTMAAVNSCYSTPNTKTSLVGVLKRYALVSKGGNISLFIDGVKTLLAAGTGNAYNVASFISDAPDQLVYSICIGALTASSSDGIPASRGPMRFTMRALYTANYTPQPINGLAP